MKLAALSVGTRRPAETFGDLHPELDVWRITDGRFSFADVINWALDYTGPAEAMISTWSIGAAETLLIHQLLVDGRIAGLRLLCDHAFRSIRRGQSGRDSIDVVRYVLDYDQFRTVNNHAKAAVLTGERASVGWITSANLNQNPRAESWGLTAYPPRVEGLSQALETMWNLGTPGYDYIAAVERRAGDLSQLEGEMSTASLRLVRDSQDAERVTRKPIDRKALARLHRPTRRA